VVVDPNTDESVVFDEPSEPPHALINAAASALSSRAGLAARRAVRVVNGIGSFLRSLSGVVPAVGMGSMNRDGRKAA
jgi:hypothetical protein